MKYLLFFAEIPHVIYTILIVLGVKSRYANAFYGKVAWLQLTPNHNDKTGKTMKTYRIFITSLLFSLVLISANAATYKWLDENGNVVYSQQPPKEGPFETIKTAKPSSSTPPSTPTLPQSLKAKKQVEAAEQQLEGKLQQETANLEKIRAENCKAAKHNLEAYTVTPRIINAQGEFVRLDDNERARLIQEAKDNIKEFCD